MDESRSSGSLVCVGLGMTLGSHLGPLARSHIEQADVVFAGLHDTVVLAPALPLQSNDADDALYRAKREGRNRVSLSDSRHVRLSPA